jgi:hypothetical protein
MSDKSHASAAWPRSASRCCACSACATPGSKPVLAAGKSATEGRMSATAAHHATHARQRPARARRCSKTADRQLGLKGASDHGATSRSCSMLSLLRQPIRWGATQLPPSPVQSAPRVRLRWRGFRALGSADGTASHTCARNRCNRIGARIIPSERPISIARSQIPRRPSGFLFWIATARRGPH